MNPKLSICIPTYNRSRFIGEALQSIIDQGSDQIEIVVSDNASTDNTKEIISNFQQQVPYLHYFCWDKNMGFDQNVLKVVEQATGEYCWLLGSDDKVEAGSIKRILDALEKYPNIGGICLGYVEYNQDMIQVGTRYNPTLGRYNDDMLFNNIDNCFDVLGYYLGYFSGQVINRGIWSQIAQQKNWLNYCNGFVHIYMVGSVLQKSSSWLFLYEPCVSKRINDELLPQLGFYQRLRFDIIRTQEAMLGFLKPGSHVYESMIKQGISYHLTTQIAHARLNNLLDTSSLIKLMLLCIRYYYKYIVFWLKVFPLFIIPPTLIPLAKQIYQKTLKPII